MILSCIVPARVPTLRFLKSGIHDPVLRGFFLVGSTVGISIIAGVGYAYFRTSGQSAG
jgi:hypothetical protein